VLKLKPLSRCISSLVLSLSFSLSLSLSLDGWDGGFQRFFLYNGPGGLKDGYLYLKSLVVRALFSILRLDFSGCPNKNLYYCIFFLFLVLVPLHEDLIKWSPNGIFTWIGIL